MKKQLISALEELIKNDRFLLEKSVNERTITHKLATYLEKYYPIYSVDCEYNRKLNDTGENVPKKMIVESNKELIRKDDSDGKTVFPDIIVHSRGNNDSNILVIEVKKTDNLNKKDIQFDKDKLEAYKKTFNYNNAYFINIPVGKDLKNLQNIEDIIEEI